MSRMETLDLPFAKATVHIFTNPDDFWQYIVRISTASIANVPEPHIAASGGSAAKVFDHISDEVLDKAVIWLVDDRYVPDTHEDSNVKTLLSSIPIVRFNVFNTEIKRATAAQIYSDALKKELLEKGYLFDLTYLGVGPDGHFASLFPHSEALLVTDQLATTSETDEFAVRERLTLTIPAIQFSNKILVVMIGAAKREIFKQITTEQTNATEVPARMLLNWPQVEVCWLNV